MKKILWMFILILVSLSCRAQSSNLDDPEAYFIAVIVEDMDRSIHWYKDVFGFSVVDTYENADRGLRQANLKRADILIELIEIGSSVGNEELLRDHPPGTRARGYFKIGIRVIEFDNWLESFEVKRVDFHGSVVIDSKSGKKMVIVKDPDGNRIQVFEK